MILFWSNEWESQFFSMNPSYSLKNSNQISDCSNYINIFMTLFQQSTQKCAIVGCLQLLFLSTTSVNLNAMDALPFKTRPHLSNAPLFESLNAEKTGIDLVHQFPNNAPFNMLTDQGSGSGVCIGDVDGDNYQIYFSPTMIMVTYSIETSGIFILRI
jgi:hypothetical protein